MLNIFLIFVLILVLLILLFLLWIFKRSYNRFVKRNSFEPLLPTSNAQEYNPDINTNNWDLHKIRLMKFGRSQYKGLTFFVNSEDGIYYFSEDGTKVYC